MDDDEADSGFGSFLASFIENKIAALVVTIVLMLVFSFCFIVNYFTHRVTKKLEKFILHPENVTFGINSEPDSRDTLESSGDSRDQI